MPTKFYCPYGLRVRGFANLLCKTLLKDGKVPQATLKKAEACCAYQYFCPVTQQWEHTAGCGRCRARENGGEK